VLKGDYLFMQIKVDFLKLRDKKKPLLSKQGLENSGINRTKLS